MTDNFRTKLRQGCYGNVCKGKLPNGVPIVVKVLDNPTMSGEEFTNEIGMIRRIHHVNIICLLGFCVEGSTRALIYKFMPNESLDKHIVKEDASGTSIFSWVKLLDMAKSIARGMNMYSLGMLLLEMISGSKDMDDVDNKVQTYFPERVFNHLKQEEELRLAASSIQEMEIARKLAIIALWCVQWRPMNRLSMKQVVLMLKESTESLALPPNPFVSQFGENNMNYDAQEIMIETMMISRLSKAEEWNLIRIKLSKTTNTNNRLIYVMK